MVSQHHDMSCLLQPGHKVQDAVNPEAGSEARQEEGH